ncbi:MAG: type IV secretory system conjugative DNA transfer family protein [Hyphomicrobiales bacterium]|nr:type IV secretory system conjugative DNA transfer family protein [Hyphomicrobiales bacterium]MCP5372208.1 type IV secretory system conjugative DNA transfer family protein [Hyphomicrobiales bacterium]
MARKVAETIAEDGLLVGWSLEHQRRKRIFGFEGASDRDPDVPIKHLEPILFQDTGHLVSVAPTGAGKGTGCIIPALLRHKGPVIVIDPKGENYAVTARRRREMGQDVILLDPFGITGAADRAAFNPIDVIKRADGTVDADEVAAIATLASPSVAQRGDSKNAFWDNMGRQLLMALILYVIHVRGPEDHNLGHVVRLLNSDIEDFDRMAKDMARSDSADLRQIAGVLSNPASETLGGYLAHALEQLAYIRGADVVSALDRTTFDPEAIVRGDPLSVYLVLPPAKLESHSGLLRLWVGCFMGLLTRRRHRVEQPTLFVVDEAAQLGHMPQLKQAITLLRGYGVQVWSFWQDLGQLQTLYPRDWTVILNNCKVHQFFGARTWMAAEQIRQVTGLFSADAILTLAHHEMLLSVAGDETVIARLPNYRSDTPFAGMVDENPFYSAAPPPEPAPDQDAPQRVYRRNKPVDNVADAPSEALMDWSKTAAAGGATNLLRHYAVNPDAWTTLDDGARDGVLDRIAPRLEQQPYPTDTARLSRWSMPFFKDVDLYCLHLDDGGRGRLAFFAASPQRLYFFDGTSDRIHAMNENEGLDLDSHNVIDYLFFFSATIITEEGRFLIVDEFEDILWSEQPESDIEEMLRDSLGPVRLTDPGQDRDAPFMLEAAVLYGDSLFRARFRTHRDGNVEMVGDEPIMTGLRVDGDRTFKDMFLAL